MVAMDTQTMRSQDVKDENIRLWQQSLGNNTNMTSRAPQNNQLIVMDRDLITINGISHNWTRPKYQYFVGVTLWSVKLKYLRLLLFWTDTENRTVTEQTTSPQYLTILYFLLNNTVISWLPRVIIWSLCSHQNVMKLNNSRQRIRRLWSEVISRRIYLDNYFWMSLLSRLIYFNRWISKLRLRSDTGKCTEMSGFSLSLFGFTGLVCLQRKQICIEIGAHCLPQICNVEMQIWWSLMVNNQRCYFKRYSETVHSM